MYRWLSARLRYLKCVSTGETQSCTELSIYCSVYCVYIFNFINEFQCQLAIYYLATTVNTKYQYVTCHVAIHLDFWHAIWRMALLLAEIIWTWSYSISHRHFLVPIPNTERSLEQRQNVCYLQLKYRKISNIRCTKYQNINDSRIILQLSLSNPLNAGVKLRMKM